MSMSEGENYVSATANCRICSKMLFLEENPVHYRCLSTKEKKLTDMVLSLKCELSAMKKSFEMMEGILKTIGCDLNIEEIISDSDSEPENEPENILPRRILRKQTVEKTQQINQGMSNRRVHKRKNQGSVNHPTERSPTYVSPLALPNGTSSQHVSICKNKQKTVTTVHHDEFIMSNPLLTVSVPDVSSMQPSTPLVSSEPSPEEACGITVVPPPKSIFISRLGVDVSTEQVEKFIKTKIPTAVDFSIRKMMFRTSKGYSSFVINMGNNINLFNMVVDQSFWPALTMVKEFQHFLRAPRTYSNLQ